MKQIICSSLVVCVWKKFRNTICWLGRCSSSENCNCQYIYKDSDWNQVLILFGLDQYVSASIGVFGGNLGLYMLGHMWFTY